MRYFLDTEFIEDGRTIDLLSIGIVAEDGREYYRQAGWTDHAKANAWVQKFVLPHLVPCPGGRPPLYAHLQDPEPIQIQNLSDYPVCNKQRTPECLYRRKRDMAEELVTFCNPQSYGTPEFWGYYADYDWVVLCQMFGTMMDLPEGWPMYCRDIKQLADDQQEVARLLLDKSDYRLMLPKQSTDEHHALADARWNQRVHRYLTTQEFLDQPEWKL